MAYTYHERNGKAKEDQEISKGESSQLACHTLSHK